MKIRFLRTTPSGVEGFPFQAGQIIDVPAPTPDQLAWLDGVQAEALKEVEPETAVVRDPERAVKRTREKS